MTNDDASISNGYVTNIVESKSLGPSVNDETTNIIRPYFYSDTQGTES